MYRSKAACIVTLILVQQINLVLSECIHEALYPHSIDCRLFYKCSFGELFELSCREGRLHFNPSLNICDFPENVNCRSVIEQPQTTELTSPTELTPPTPSPTTLSPTTTSSPTTLSPQVCQWEPGQEIEMGNRCDVQNGFFVFQPDGNAVIYDNNHKPLWNTETAGIGHKFIFQTDGNLVIYSETETAVWNSGSHNRGGSLLEFQCDRNLVIYDAKSEALWNTGTSTGPCETTSTTTALPTTTTLPPTTAQPPTTSLPPITTTPSTSTTIPTTITPPQICQWEPGQQIEMGNRCDVPHGYFTFQTDGNAVIYDINSTPIWHTSTTGIGHEFVFQTDGNLVMYSLTGAAVWNAGIQDWDARILQFQCDRNLVIYNTVTYAWHSDTEAGLEGRPCEEN